MSNMQKKKKNRDTCIQCLHSYTVKHFVVLLQDFVKIQMIEDTLMNDHTDGHGENLPASPLLRYYNLTGICVVLGLIKPF